jgi:lysyl-tRNA synthetase class 2
MHIMDETGKIQVYLKSEDVGDVKYKLLKKLDIGDIIGIKGYIFKTKTGELTVYTQQFEILCKALRPLPEKFHGLKDPELRYRRRYLDLMMNRDVRETFKQRSVMVRSIRQFFHDKGFMEVETPALQVIYGGANAKPFETHINAWDMKMYLSISPELYLKKLIVGGLEKVFTICKNFRNEGVDRSHNPEFTMLECYQSWVDYDEMMRLLEQCYEQACIAMNGSTKVKQIYQGKEVELDFKTPWKRMTMLDGLKDLGGIDASKMSVSELKDQMLAYNIEYEDELTWGLGVQLLFEELVEDKLVQPVHIIDHPKESTPLCKAHRKDDRLIERFESFCMGMELSNAYSELNDPILQRKLLMEQAEELRAGAEEAHPMDEDFVQSIEYGMTPTGGLGFGIDRMAILLTGVECIRDVILFPTMKPVGEEKSVEEQEDENVKKLKDALSPYSVQLYDDDPYMKECESEVLSVDGEKVFLKQTCFYMEGGGQAGDSGTVDGLTVKNTKKIQRRAALILEEKAPFKPGDKVKCVLDWERRHKIMRLHSASHIMEHFLFKIAGEKKLVNTMVSDEKDTSVYKGQLEAALVAELEKTVNQFIADKKEIRTEIDPEKEGYRWWVCDEIRMGCGGTHVKNTSEIGKLRIKVNRIKDDMFSVITELA